MGYPDAIKHRCAERLFGEKSTGRLTKAHNGPLSKVVEETGWDAVLATYVVTGRDTSRVDPRDDTCLRAFCRILQLEEEATEVRAAG